MKRYVTVTQCLLWYLSNDRRLPKAVSRIFDAAEVGRAQILIPSIVLVEAILLLQRVAQDVVKQLLAIPEESNATLYVVPLNKAIVTVLTDFGPAAIPELADRIIAATARTYDLPLLTTDTMIIASNMVKVVD